MKLAEWFRPPRAVLTLFMGLMAVCALALGWLGWQVLVQDRAVETERERDQLESAADRAVAAMERALGSPDAQVTIAVNGDLEVTPPGRLAYVPAQAAVPPIRADLFAEAEALEFGKQDGGKAAEAYRRLAEAGSAQVRAEALMRLGRMLRHQRKWPDALQAYASLESSVLL